MDPTLDFIPEEPDSQPLPEEPGVPIDSMEPTIDEPSSSVNPPDSQPVSDDELAPPATQPSDSECEYDKYRPEDKAIPYEWVPRSPPKKCKNKEEEIKKLVALVANLKKERSALTLSRCWSSFLILLKGQHNSFFYFPKHPQTSFLDSPGLQDREAANYEEEITSMLSPYLMTACPMEKLRWTPSQCLTC